MTSWMTPISRRASKLNRRGNNGAVTLFRRTTRDSKRALDARLPNKHVVRLIKQTVVNAAIRRELSEKDGVALFSGHSLRAGLASSAEVDERYIQKQLGHASAEITRRYQPSAGSVPRQSDEG